jgi:hypothetical protein
MSYDEWKKSRETWTKEQQQEYNRQRKKMKLEIEIKIIPIRYLTSLKKNFRWR